MAVNEVTSVDVKTLTPFKRFIMTLGELPTSYLESMTYAELVMWFCNFLQEKVLPTINNNADALQDVITYLENLDLQDEVDHKLDEMVEAGTLQEIVADYLNSKAIFGFDNVAGMKSATNFVNGSYAKTLGYSTKNDGGSALYKIRTITNDDVIDEMFIIELNDNTLIAELIYNEQVNIKQLGAVGDGTTDDSDTIINALAKVNKVIIDNGDYKIDKDIEIPRNNITIQGISYRSTNLIFDTGKSLKFIGTSITASGTHKNFLTLENIKFSTSNINTDSSIPIIQLINCSYVKINNCWITGQGRQVLMWECFDSRITNTDFEWGGSSTDSTIFGFELRSQNGGNVSLPTYEYTNNIYFQGCRFESHVGTCIGSTGQHTNKIFFESCKFESFNCLNQKALNLTHCETIYLTNSVLAGDIGNTKNYFYTDNVNNFTITGYCEHASHNNLSYSGEPLLYVAGTGNIVVNIQLNNNNAYTIDQKKFGLDTWGDWIFINGDIRVNKYSNKNTLITTKKESVATLTSGSTTLNYTCPSNGWIYVSMVGPSGTTGHYRLVLKNNTANYELRIISVDDVYATGFMPVSAGDNIICTGNTTSTAYITFFNNIGFPTS